MSVGVQSRPYRGSAPSGAQPAPRIAFIGCVAEGRRSLEALLAQGEHVTAIFTLNPSAAATVCGAVGWRDLAAHHGIPLLEVASMKDPQAVRALRALRPDLVFCVGWTQLLPPAVLAIPPLGVIGFHASLLPLYRGRAPVNWALIHGETRTGNTMLALDDGVDTGDIIAQRDFPITAEDTCGTLYDKVARSEVEMIAEVMPLIRAGQMPRRPQDSRLATLMPRRRPEDGAIDWRRGTAELDRWVRALTHPYPGAFTSLNGSRVWVWKAAVSARAPGAGPPGWWRLRSDPPALMARTGDGELIVERVQPEGGEELGGLEFAARLLPDQGALAS